MQVAYGIRRADDSLVVVGSVRFQQPNAVTLKLSEQAAFLGAQEAMGAGVALRAFVLLAPAALASWNAAQIPDLSDAKAEAKLWANAKGKRSDHRKQTFQGYPIRANMTLLVPMVDLSKYEPEHSGFIEALSLPEEGSPEYEALPMHEQVDVDQARYHDSVENPPREGTWGEQVAWIRERLAEGMPEAAVAEAIDLPLESIEAAKTWVDQPKPKRRARSLDDL